MIRSLTAAFVALACSLPAMAGDGAQPTILEPITYALPMAATFIPPLVPARQGQAAEGRLVVLGGDQGTTFSILSGRLPTGTTLAGDGSLAGTFARPGLYEARIRAASPDGRDTDADVRVEVAPSE